MKILVFTGPSISHSKAEEILDAVYLPPLKQADLTSAVCTYNPDLIAIIDGFAGSHGSVWHNEILYALKMGIKVYGAGAMGAIRAMEMCDLGMIGKGRIYQMYKNGTLTDDDEIMCIFGSEKEGYPRLSEPLVNIRATFDRALEQGIITDTANQILVSIAKETYWCDRTFSVIFEKARELPEKTVEKLKSFVNAHYADIQKQDAEILLQAISKLSKADLKDSNKIRVFPENMFQVIYERDRKVQHDNTGVPLFTAARHIALNHPEIEDINFHALNRSLVGFLAGLLKVEASQEDTDNETRRFQKKHGLKEKHDFNTWLAENDLSAEEFDDLMREMAVCRRLQQWFMGRQRQLSNTKTLLNELRIRNEYKKWMKMVANAEDILEDKTDDIRAMVSSKDLKSVLTDRLRRDGFPWNTGVLNGASELGLTQEDLHVELIKEKIVRDCLQEIALSLFA